jgi:hypothetical protein
MPATPKGLSKASWMKKSEDTDQEIESRDSSGPYPTSEAVGSPGKTKDMAPERTEKIWHCQIHWCGMARLLEEELTASIGLLCIWTHPSKLNEATHQKVQEIDQMVDQEAIATLENLQNQKYVQLAGKTGKLTVGLQLGFPGLVRKIGVATLLDNGCDGSSVDHHFVKRNKIQTKKVVIMNVKTNWSCSQSFYWEQAETLQAMHSTVHMPIYKINITVCWIKISHTWVLNAHL